MYNKAFYDFWDSHRDMILRDAVLNRNLFNYNQIEKILDNHNNRKSSEEYRIWALVNLELWFRTWIDRDPANSNQ